MIQSHWKIRNLDNRKAYYVPIHKSFDMTALDQVKAFMVEHGIMATQCRIIETGGRFINKTFFEFVWNEMLRKSKS